ncbi:TonB-dependent receptor [Phenylobacterium sp.]|uniref:TonB-dependent receptor n=1 Tax=Phenylobacterium sp. TaxID=1871053 RepID=UPI0025D6B7E4|nr:TonB-dependent receptor [Phenylobacterium sp.]MBX3484113.1 TonB-dependent receptor [Phenylobacterium sp.]MCW5758476.1 TonB-dependent receptor [Phenylobacterium sp.]
MKVEAATLRRACLLGTSALALSVGIGVGAAQAQARATPSDVEEIVVTGQRAADKKALDTKLNSDALVESLFADDVGKLPDQNVAEAVKRLPGISVANDQGEGRYVIIRGVSPDLANVTLNGQTAAAPEPGSRQVKLDDIPSSLIGNVEVVKSLTPDRDANAIAGQVDINTLTAFDRNRTFANARVAYGQYNINDKHPRSGDVTAGTVFGPDRQFGVVLSASYDKRPIESQNTQGASNYRTIGGFSGVPDDFRIRDYNLVRKREGYVANFDWRPTDDATLFLRNTYSKFGDNESRDQVRYEIPTAITNQTATSGTFNTRASRLIRRRIEDDHTYSISGGGDFKLWDGDLKAVATYTRAVKEDPLRSEFNFRTANNAFSASYDLSGDPFIVTPAAAAFDPTRYVANTVNYDQRKAQEDLYQVAVDYKHPIAFGDDGSYVKFGAKYLKRDKTNRRDFQQYSLSGFTLAEASYLGKEATFDGRYVFGPRIDYDRAQAYVVGHPAQAVFNLAGSRVNSLANDYRVHEKITAAYVMGSFKTGALTVIPGVRLEHTSEDFAAKTITAASPLDMDFNTFDSRSYTDIFPGVNVRYDITPTFVARAAATTAIGRPNYADLPPFISVDAAGNSVSRGNPDLKPLKSVNLDASLEYYLPTQGVLSVGVFYKTIDNPIYSEAVTQSGTFGGIALTNALVTTPRNADKAVVKGIEFNAQSYFTFLPGWMSGFGAAANLTFVDSEESGLAGRPDKIRFTLQSKRVGSLQLFYEKYGLQARVAYSYRSPYLDLVGTDPTTDQFTDKNGSWDVHVSYEVNERFEVFAEGTNLNDEPWRRYIGSKNQLVEIERYDWSAKVGFQFKY